MWGIMYDTYFALGTQKWQLGFSLLFFIFSMTLPMHVVYFSPYFFVFCCSKEMFIQMQNLSRGSQVPACFIALKILHPLFLGAKGPNVSSETSSYCTKTTNLAYSRIVEVPHDCSRTCRDLGYPHLEWSWKSSNHRESYLKLLKPNRHNFIKRLNRQAPKGRIIIIATKEPRKESS